MILLNFNKSLKSVTHQRSLNKIFSFQVVAQRFTANIMNQIQDYPLDLSVPKAKELDNSSKPPLIKTKVAIYCRRRRCGKELLVCEICLKKFDRPSLLKRHSRVHTGLFHMKFFLCYRTKTS